MKNQIFLTLLLFVNIGYAGFDPSVATPPKDASRKLDMGFMKEATFKLPPDAPELVIKDKSPSTTGYLHLKEAPNTDITCDLFRNTQKGDLRRDASGFNFKITKPKVSGAGVKSYMFPIVGSDTLTSLMCSCRIQTDCLTEDQFRKIFQVKDITFPKDEIPSKAPPLTSPNTDKANHNVGATT